jgi:hypothetical protein
LIVEAVTGALFGVAWWMCVTAGALTEPFDQRLIRFAVYAAFCFVLVVITFFLAGAVSKGLFPQQDTGMLQGRTNASADVSPDRMSAAQWIDSRVPGGRDSPGCTRGASGSLGFIVEVMSVSPSRLWGAGTAGRTARLARSVRMHGAGVCVHMHQRR